MLDPDTYDWRKFEIVQYYDQAIDIVFRSWTTSSGLCSFFIEECRFLTETGGLRGEEEPARAGDSYHWRWRHPVSLEGEVTKCVLNEELHFTFGSMKVEVLFSETGSQTELHLVQSGIEDSPKGRVLGHLNCRSCWVFFLTNLRSVLDTGHDLRDADPARASSIEVGFVPLTRAN